MLGDFEKILEELNSLADNFFPSSDLEVFYKRLDKISLRIVISSELFIDVYANTDTGRYDFSLIHKEKRIFGYDNLHGWHCHPLQNPEEHFECGKPQLQQIFKEIAEIVEELSRKSEDR